LVRSIAGKCVGEIAARAYFSFSTKKPNRHGDGGCITTNDPALLEKTQDCARSRSQARIGTISFVTLLGQ